MAAINVTDVQALLGRFVVLEGTVHGFRFERRGLVTAVVRAIPSSRGEEAILLEESGREPEFYGMGSFDLLHVE